MMHDGLNGIDVDPQSFNDLLDMGKMNVSLERLPIYETTSFLRLQELFHTLTYK